MARLPRLRRTVANHRGVIVGVDVETACQTVGAICSIGVAVVQDGMVAGSHHWLTDPRTDFDPRFIQIHGIKPSDVRGRPSIRDAWDEIRTFLERAIAATKPPLLFAAEEPSADLGTDALFVAHNAQFDRSQIEGAIGAPLPFQLSCTVAMSRRAFPRLQRHNLRSVADHLGIALNHHDALSDATACALIAHRCLRELQGS